ncbi:hypothetical protein [Neptunomonas japonica]|uniref:Uncharacterized protein n=1 Tax=Neptunomonas japonica JAMM 1380 TaxID=1441457 RepID=A0A7R6PA58_9GAMM|nr:hypothetical protein [Neptunomonas japonica]BBB30063.1 hypothetical protein NEJAP_2115 [Neptunomonas japonica JAMM 1380]
MQTYRLLGTVNLPLERDSIVSQLVLSGWNLLIHSEDEDVLKKDRIQLNLQGEGTLLLDASFKGMPEDISELVGCFDKHSGHYALDLFGDSARLVRRFIK